MTTSTTTSASRANACGNPKPSGCVTARSLAATALGGELRDDDAHRDVGV